MQSEKRLLKSKWMKTLPLGLSAVLAYLPLSMGALKIRLLEMIHTDFYMIFHHIEV